MVEPEYGRGNTTGLTGSHHDTGVDSRIDSGHGEFDLYVYNPKLANVVL